MSPTFCSVQVVHGGQPQQCTQNSSYHTLSTLHVLDDASVQNTSCGHRCGHCSCGVCKGREWQASSKASRCVSARGRQRVGWRWVQQPVHQDTYTRRLGCWWTHSHRAVCVSILCTDTRKFSHRSIPVRPKSYFLLSHFYPDFYSILVVFKKIFSKSLRLVVVIINDTNMWTDTSSLPRVRISSHGLFPTGPTSTTRCCRRSSRRPTTAPITWASGIR